MDEQRIREIAREEAQKVAMSNDTYGAPVVAPHHHNGTDNLLINLETLGMYPLPDSKNKVLFPSITNSNGVQSNNFDTAGYGFASSNSLEQASNGHLQQYVNTPVFINPVPVVVGNGVGVQSAFNGGSAPDGTIVAFMTGAASTSYLYVRFDGSWYGVNLNATPITP